MNVTGLSRSLGTQLSIKKDGGKVKIAINVEALKDYVVELIEQSRNSHNPYYLQRAALFSRTMVDTGLTKFTGFVDDHQSNRFMDVTGYNTPCIMPVFGKTNPFSDQISPDEKIELDTSDMKPKKERKVQIKKARKTSQEKIDEAIERIKQRNERTRKLNAKDMAIIKKESDKLTQCAEYVQKAAEIFAA